MLEIICGRAGRGKSTLLAEMAAAVPPLEKAFVLVPEQYAVQKERDLLHIIGNKLSMNTQVMGFKRLAEYIFRIAGGTAAQYVDADTARILMARTLRELSPSLKVFAAASRRVEFVEKVLALHGELCGAGLSAEVFFKVDCGESLGGKLGELSLILLTYEGMLKEQTDMRDPLRMLDYAVEKLKETAVFEGCHFFIDAFTDFTGVEMRLLEEIIKTAGSVTAFFCCDGIHSKASLFERQRAAANSLITCAKANGIKTAHRVLSERVQPVAPGIDAAESLLYDFCACPDGEAGGVKIACASDIYEELEMVCENILTLVREESYRFRDFAVVARDIDVYTAAAASVFGAYGLPYYCSQRRAVKNKPLFSLMLSALRCVFENFRYEDVIGCFKSGLADISLCECDLLENYVYAWRISGKSAWEADFKLHPRGFNREWDQKARKSLEFLNELRERAIAPLLRLCENTKGGGAERISGAIDVFLQELCVRERLELQEETLIAISQPRLAQEAGQLYDILSEINEKLGNFCGGDATVKQYAELLTLAVKGATVGSIPTSADEIMMGSADMMRPGSVRCCFILGFAQGEFPRSAPAPGILTESERKKLDFLKQRSPLQFAAEERYYIYAAVTSAVDRLFISYSKSGSGESERRISYVGEILKRQLPGLAVSYRSEDERDRPESLIERVQNRHSAVKVYSLLPEGDPLAVCIKNTLADGIFEDKAEADMRHALKPETASRLYTNTAVSPTRFERYAGCQFSYFCEYGLSLSSRTKIEYDAAAAGTFMHYCLEKIVPVISVEPERYLDYRLLAVLVDQTMSEYIEAFLPELSKQGKRFYHTLLRLKSILNGFLKNLLGEFVLSDFKPAAFELKLGSEIEALTISAGETALCAKGIVDRVDLYERDGKTYVRVVDYKTGSKSFSFAELWSGLSLQLPLYLEAILKNGGRFGKNLVPAGIIFNTVKYESVEADRNLNEDELSDSLAAQSPASGLLLHDAAVLRAMDRSGLFKRLPVKVSAGGEIDKNRSSLASKEEFDALLKYVKTVILKGCAKISSGSIEINPVKDILKDACAFCKMHSLCRYSGTGRAMPKMSAGDFFDAIAKELKDGR